MMRTTTFLLALSLVSIGCGADAVIDAQETDAGANIGTNVATNAETPDAGEEEDMGQEPVDMGQEPVDMGQEPVDMGQEPVDMGGDDVGQGNDAGSDGGTEPACDINGFSVTSSAVNSIGTDVLFYEAYEGMETDQMFKLLDFAIYAEYGATAEPQTVTFNGENYEDCGLCLLAYECTPTTCGVTYLVETGTVNVTAAGYTQGDSFSATFSDIVLREVTIDSDTLVSTPVTGGKTWCIESLTATGTTVAN